MDKRKTIGKALKLVGQLIENEPSEQALLTEYQVCEQDSRSKVSTHWTVVSIFIGINTALLGAVAYMLANNSLSNNIQWIVLSLGVALSAVFVCLWIWLNRVNKLVTINDNTMRGIEGDLNIRVKTKLEGDGSWPIKGVYIVFILLWIFFIIAAFLPCI